MLTKLFFVFARIGLFTFGGGYAMLPLMQRELVRKHGWITDEDLIAYYAIGQCTPGVIAVNTATFVGYRLKGIPGAISATLGVITPSLLILMAIAAFLQDFAEYAIVQHAFAGIRVAVCALIFYTILRLIQKGVKDLFSVAVLLATFLSLVLLKWSPIPAVLLSALAGIVYLRREDTK